MTRYVYIVEQGAYSNRAIVGVYDSPEAAIEDHPLPADVPYPKTPSAANASRRGGWQPCFSAGPGRAWSNGLDWEDVKNITRYEVQSLSTPAGDRER